MTKNKRSLERREQRVKGRGHLLSGGVGEAVANALPERAEVLGPARRRWR